jgi:ABC-type taurine transport system ATPase subunit
MLQEDLLLPWRSILANNKFGLESRGLDKAHDANG